MAPLKMTLFLFVGEFFLLACFYKVWKCSIIILIRTFVVLYRVCNNLATKKIGWSHTSAEFQLTFAEMCWISFGKEDWIVSSVVCVLEGITLVTVHATDHASVCRVRNCFLSSSTIAGMAELPLWIQGHAWKSHLHPSLFRCLANLLGCCLNWRCPSPLKLLVLSISLSDCTEFRFS